MVTEMPRYLAVCPACGAEIVGDTFPLTGPCPRCGVMPGEHDDPMTAPLLGLLREWVALAEVYRTRKLYRSPAMVELVERTRGVLAR